MSRPLDETLIGRRPLPRLYAHLHRLHIDLLEDLVENVRVRWLAGEERKLKLRPLVVRPGCLPSSFESCLDRLCVRSYGVKENFWWLDRVRVLAHEKALSVPQVALTYVLSQPLNTFALVGCASGAEFRDNLEVARAGGTSLSPEEVAWLELRADARVYGA